MTNPKPRLLFYVLHLLGVGHVYRAKRLIEGFAQEGIAVDVIYGGGPVEGLTFEAESVHFLPPIRAADNAYTSYLDENGAPLERPYLEERSRKLLKIFSGLQPDIILIEAFPFGRRMVRHELGALIEEASRRDNSPLIVSSVRDILQERKKSGRVEETRDWIRDKFDHVLVHSDPNVIRLDATFPLADEIAGKLSYTGFVVPDHAETTETDCFDIIVTAGGGAFGGELLQTALEAARKSSPDLKWCLATGDNAGDGQLRKLLEIAPDNVQVQKRLNNLAAHMKLAKVSVSQCGYNTAMDALAAHRDSGCRAVFVPYDTEGQSEQLRRSELLENAGYAVNLPQSRLTAQRLFTAIEKASTLSKVEHDLDFEGVAKSARVVRTWLDERV